MNDTQERIEVYLDEIRCCRWSVRSLKRDIERLTAQLTIAEQELEQLRDPTQINGFLLSLGLDEVEFADADRRIRMEYD